MTDKPATDKPIFSFKELMYVLTLVIGFLIQHYTMKQEFHDAIVEMSYDIKENKQLIVASESRIDSHDGLIKAHDRRLTWLATQIGAAIKPKELQIEPE